MKPLIVLIAAFVISLLGCWLVDHHFNIYLAGQIAMTCMLFFTTIGHFLFPKGMTMMIPPFIPFKKTMVYITGIMEILMGFGLLIPSTQVSVGWALVFFFILVLPSNIYAAIKQVDYQRANYQGKGLSYLWFRIPMQIFLITWVLVFVLKVI
jgi:uncharacterized membrane protein